MKRLFSFLICMFLVMGLSVCAFAAEYDSVDDLIEDVQEVVEMGDSEAPPDSSAPQEVEGQGGGVLTIPDPLEVIVVDPAENSTLSVTGSGWSGSISTNLLDYFTGIVSQNPSSDYIVFKSDRYNTYLFYGDGFSYSSGRFSGTGAFICYNSDSQLFSRGTDSFSLSDGGYYIYTNLSTDYPALYEVEGGKYEKVIAVGLGIIFSLYAFDRIFFRKCRL